MSDPRVLQRGLGRSQWQVRKLAMDRETAVVRCPGCGAVGTLDEYSITTDGVVLPVFQCMNECGFSASIQLGGWRDR